MRKNAASNCTLPAVLSGAPSGLSHWDPHQLGACGLSLKLPGKLRVVSLRGWLRLTVNARTRRLQKETASDHFAWPNAVRRKNLICLCADLPRLRLNQCRALLFKSDVGGQFRSLRNLGS